MPTLKQYGIDDWKDYFLPIGLVQNKKTVTEFVRDLKQYDTQDDWTYHVSDHDLRDISEDALLFSQSMTTHLVKYGFTIYDTSLNREQVLNQIVADIKLNLA